MVAVARVDRVDYLGRLRVVDSRGIVQDTGGELAPGDIPARLTSEGYLAVEGHISGTGVYQYTDAEGNSWGELRLPEHVFAPESMASFHNKPITDDHPPVFVTADNWQQFARGNLGSNIRPNAAKDHVLSDMLITSTELIDKVGDGKSQLSNGYSTVLIDSPGVWNGIPYRFIQTQIVGNHNAVVDEARGGAACCILDRADSAFTVYGDTMKIKDATQLALVFDHAKKNDAKPKMKFTSDGKYVQDATLTIGDQTFEIPDELAMAALEKMRQLEAEATDPAAAAAAPPAPPTPDDVANPVGGPPQSMEIIVKPVGDIGVGQEATPNGQPPLFKGKDPKDSAALQAQVDSLQAQLDDPNRVDARVNLVTNAKNVLGENEETDGKADAVLMQKVVAKIHGDDSKINQTILAQFKAATNAKSDSAIQTAMTYLRSAYDSAVHSFKKDKATELMSRTFDSIANESGDDDLMKSIRQSIDSRDGVKPVAAQAAA